MDKKTIHNLLKAQAAKMLRNRGFNEIMFEYQIDTFRADVVGIKAGYMVAVECGRTPMKRYHAFKNWFDEVILLKYSDYLPQGEAPPKHKQIAKCILHEKYVLLLRSITEKKKTTISALMRHIIKRYLAHVEEYGVSDLRDILKRLNVLESQVNELKAKLGGLINGL